MHPVTLVIAAEYRMYKWYLRAKGLNEKDHRFVNAEEKLLGYARGTPVVVVTVGKYRGGADMLEDIARASGYDVRRETV